MKWFAPTAIVLVLLAGCGGGGTDTIVSPPPSTVFASNVHQLPSDGSVKVSAVSPTSVTLTGSPPTLKAGDILLSTMGSGLLRTVASITHSGGNTVVTTSGATVTDAIKQCNLALTKPITAADVTTFTPAFPGITLGNATPRSPRTVSGSLTLHIPTIQVLTNPSVTIAGDVDFTINLDTALQIDGFKIEHFRFVPGFDVSTTLNVKGSVGAWNSQKEIKLGTLQCAPVDLGPVVIVPVIDLNAEIGGHISADLDWTPQATMSLQAGVDYTAVGGWTPVTSLATTLTNMSVKNPYLTGEVYFTPFAPKLSLLVYDIAGGSIQGELPKLDLTFTAQVANPASTNLSLDAAFSATAGIDLDIFGLDFGHDFPSLTAKTFNLYKNSFLDNSSVGVGIK